MALCRAQAPDDQHQKIRVQAILWNVLGAGSVAYALTELFENLPADAVCRKLWCLRSDPRAPHDYDSPVFPDLVFRGLAKARIPAAMQGRFGTRIALRHIVDGDIVYLWPPYDLQLIKRAQDRGAIVVAERTNCMAEMGREVLSRAYARRDMPMPKGWFSTEDIAQDREQMLQCNFVTAANALVTTSLINAGVPPQRIIETSYGFSPKRLKRALGIARPNRPPVYAFVGLGIVRKGLDVLLEAWAKANVHGTLLIAGTVDDEIRQSYATVLARPDVQELGYVQDIAAVYASADVFVFPSHEEGGPQVIYEAAGCGLPSIVSPMGAGRIVRDQIECVMINPIEVDDLSRAIVKMAEDRDFRQTLAQNAAKRAREFTWSKVGHQLYEKLLTVANSSQYSAKWQSEQPECCE